jgi:hypothetical protein
MPASLAIDNRGMTAQNVVISVASGTGTTGGAFALTATLGALPGTYTESSTARDCDVMTGGTTVEGLAGDDSTSAAIDLPFAFRYFGDPVTAFTLSSNGFAQLWATRAAAMPVSAFNNVTIPTAATPNSVVAALWDDLNPAVMGAGAAVTTRVIGTAPMRRFVVQWANFPFFGDNASRTTFQVKLFETTNVIEFHYCALMATMPASRAGGDSATVGLENATGSAGVLHSFNRAMSINTTNAIRFTP